jgi:hypothetical protein
MVTLEEADGGWALHVDAAEAARQIAAIRDISIKRREAGPTTLEEDLAWYEARLTEQGMNAEATRLHAGQMVRGGV